METEIPSITPPSKMAEKIEAEKAAKKDIALSDTLSLAPKTGLEMKMILRVIAEGGGIPERFDTAEKRIAAYNLATSLMGPKWQLAMNHIAIIKGQMSIYGELPGALAEQTKEVAEKEVYCVDASFKKISIANKNVEESPYSGVCIIQRKGRRAKEFFYTIKDAATAGQLPAMKWSKQDKKQVPNPDSPWVKHLRTMLMRKAMAIAIKMEFSDALLGTPIAEYDFDVLPDVPGGMKDVTPSDGGAAAEINDAYSDKPESTQ